MPVMAERHIEYQPVDQVVAAIQNPKRHAEADLDASLDEYGYTEPVMIDERTGRLVSGHGRLGMVRRAMQDGREPPDGVKVDENGQWLLPVVRGWASRDDAQAQRYLLFANRATEMGGWDDQDLAATLQWLDDQDSLAVTGFYDSDLADIMARLNPPDLDDLARRVGEPQPEDFWPVVRFRVPPDLRERFMVLVGTERDEAKQFELLITAAEAVRGAVSR